MITTEPKRSRWMAWEPKLLALAPSAATEPTKPTQLSSVGFVGYPPAESSVLREQFTEKITGQDHAPEELPPMPSGVLLIDWNLKEPPVAIETFSVVTDSGLFAKSTLEQLRTALTQPERWVGWSVPQLLDRLAQVGVRLTLEEKSNV